MNTRRIVVYASVAVGVLVVFTIVAAFISAPNTPPSPSPASSVPLPLKERSTPSADAPQLVTPAPESSPAPSASPTPVTIAPAPKPTPKTVSSPRAPKPSSSVSAASPSPKQSTPKPATQCTTDQYKCGDFSSCAEARAVFQSCPNDIHRLDQDGDGVPCETLCK
jgi:cytoskeletal protein RodZ